MGRTHGYLSLAVQQNFRCFFCGEKLPREWRLNKKPEGVVVHHINHDHYDNRFSNRAAAHTGCHSKYHLGDKP